jgi:hypothetical protein
MGLLRVRQVKVLDGYCLELTLTDGSVVQRNAAPLLSGPVFEPLQMDPALFREARVEGGTVTWLNGADLCPDVLIWGGPPPAEAGVAPPQRIDAA